MRLRNLFFWKQDLDEPSQASDAVFERHKKRADRYAETHKPGTRVAAENKHGIWKEGVVIGEHDWCLFTFFFTVKFDDGEIHKVEDSKITVI